MTSEHEAPESGAIDAEATPAAPAIVVRGNATPEQLAALVAVLTAASDGDEPASDGSSSTWATRTAAMRRPVSHGPGAWRSSLRP